MTREEKIALLNDRARKGLAPETTKAVVTRHVANLSPEKYLALLGLVAEFDNFDREEDDPYGEHDFGAVTLDGERFLWKIDYHGRVLDTPSPDPADASKTTRVLTIMHGSEY